MISVSDTIDRILTDMGSPVDGSGYWTRDDVRLIASHIQRDMAEQCECIRVTTPWLDVTQAAEEITFDVNGGVIRIKSAYARQGAGRSLPIAVYSEEQLTEYDGDWIARTGGTLRGIMSEMSAPGIVRPYPIMSGTDTTLKISYYRIPNEITTDDELTIDGDEDYQASGWELDGITLENTDGYKLYWTLTDDAGDYTVNLYKDTGKASGDLVATGTRTGDGTITLAASNSSGLSGSVEVAYSGNDTDAENIIAYTAIELNGSDGVVLQHGSMSMLYGLEREGKDANKSAMYDKLYASGKASIAGRVQKQKQPTYETINERAGNAGRMVSELYPTSIT